MEECNICLTKIKKQNKNKHEQSRKHKYFSNPIINKYIVKMDEFYILIDIVQPYYDEYKKKFDDFTICVKWMNNGLVVNKISVPSTFSFKQNWYGLPIIVRGSMCVFLDTFDENCINDDVDEIVIIFISDLKDMTFSHCMAQPKSMFCRKLERNFIGEDFGDFDYNWLPNCFRHINT